MGNHASEQYVADVATMLKNKGYAVVKTEVRDRWGGFTQLDTADAEQFTNEYFANIAEAAYEPGLPESPKILCVRPDGRLSDQYHDRRSEVWRVVSGQVTVFLADQNGDMPQQPTTYHPGDFIFVNRGQRHQIINTTDSWAQVAEKWRHEDARIENGHIVGNLSDEDDITRVAY